MAGNSCRYDCSTAPEKLFPYPDISGIGVSLSYTITAGLAVGIVFLYYIIAYLPSARLREESSPVLKPNPIDKYVLSFRSIQHRIELDGEARQDRLQGTLLQCILTMSDLQLITGISILISGYTQLRCGISAYHWQKLVDIAWFSSVTYLCCLTFLRTHFYHDKKSRIWRIPAMIIMMILLMVALTPTAYYVWDFRGHPRRFKPSPTDYAICYFTRGVEKPKENDSTRDLFEDKSFGKSHQSMLFSELLVGFGILLRLFRLFRGPNEAFVKMRMRCSQILRSVLGRLYSWSDSEASTMTLRRAFCYRPALAAFLTLRICLDILLSMAFEVWWLLVSYTWGVVRLWYIHRIPSGYKEPGTREWNFGQVVPLVLLAAPIISIIDSFNTGEPQHVLDKESEAARQTLKTGPHISTLSVDSISSGIPVEPLYEHPHHDWYNHSSGIKLAIFSSFIGIITLSIMILVSLASDREPLAFLLPQARIWNSVPLSFISCLFSCIFFSFAWERHITKYPKKTRLVVKAILFAIYGGTFVALAGFSMKLPTVYAEFFVSQIFSCFIGVYCTISFGEIMWAKWKSHK